MGSTVSSLKLQLNCRVFIDDIPSLYMTSRKGSADPPGTPSSLCLFTV